MISKSVVVVRRIRIEFSAQSRALPELTCESPSLHLTTSTTLPSTRWSRKTLSETMQKSRAIHSALGSRVSAPTPRISVQFQRRSLQDVAITRTGKPILKVQGGR